MKTILSRVSLIIFAFLFWLALLAGVAFVRERPGPGDARSIAPTATPPEGPAVGGPDLTDRQCGCNSLYVFLRLRGVAVDYKTVRTEVPVSARGTNLVELRDAAARLGSETTILAVIPDELRELQRPVVAHLRSAPGQDADLGHYVVLVPRRDGGVTIIDGTTGEARESHTSELSRGGWSGYVLAPDTGASPYRDAALALALFGAGFCVVWLAQCRAGRANAQPLVVRLRNR